MLSVTRPASKSTSKWICTNYYFSKLVGLRFAGTRDGNAQDLLYKYAVYFLNEVCLGFSLCFMLQVLSSSTKFLHWQIKPVSVPQSKHSLPKGLSNYVDRGTLESCLHLIVLSLCVVCAPHIYTYILYIYIYGDHLIQKW